ncbi:hypothetical protein [Kangiella sp.]|uniref:hypothetical protein n=1 Tax=Kangiella sp. TaxID=1920245 RepID=UPI00198B83D2|nr:hypothetical protein [Kangiella sp.]MBD3652711.1 hypothetical protein [Kangiella sp.]
MKFLIMLLLPFVWGSQAVNAAGVGDCVYCSYQLVAVSLPPSSDYAATVKANQTEADTVRFTDDQQVLLCRNFISNGFNALKETFQELGSSIEEGYHHVTCEDGREDLLKFRQMNPRGRADLAAFILYYKRELNREQDLVEIFNTVTPGPKVPNGTLIDFIEYYKNIEQSNAHAISEYERMITLLRRFGAKKASEL